MQIPCHRLFGLHFLFFQHSVVVWRGNWKWKIHCRIESLFNMTKTLKMGDTTESDYSVDTNHNQNSSFYEPMGPPQPNELTFAPSGPSRSDNNSTFHGLYHHANKTFAPLKNVTINESTDPTFGGTMDFYPSNPNSTFLGQTLATSLGLDQEFFGQPESTSIREGNIFRILL